MRDRPGILVFIGGVAFVLASTMLGFYIAHQTEVIASKPAMMDGDYDARFNAALMRKDPDFLPTVNALMWMVFGLGGCLTLVGLRMITRPVLQDRPRPSIGPVREVFENPK